MQNVFENIKLKTYNSDALKDELLPALIEEKPEDIVVGFWYKHNNGNEFISLITKTGAEVDYGGLRDMDDVCESLARRANNIYQVLIDTNDYKENPNTKVVTESKLWKYWDDSYKTNKMVIELKAFDVPDLKTKMREFGYNRNYLILGFDWIFKPDKPEVICVGRDCCDRMQISDLETIVLECYGGEIVRVYYDNCWHEMGLFDMSKVRRIVSTTLKKDMQYTLNYDDFTIEINKPMSRVFTNYLSNDFRHSDITESKLIAAIADDVNVDLCFQLSTEWSYRVYIVIVQNGQAYVAIPETNTIEPLSVNNPCSFSFIDGYFLHGKLYKNFKQNLTISDLNSLADRCGAKCRFRNIVQDDLTSGNEYDDSFVAYYNGK